MNKKGKENLRQLITYVLFNPKHKVSEEGKQIQNLTKRRTKVHAK